MPDEANSHNPTDTSTSQPDSKRDITPTAIQKQKVGIEDNNTTNNQRDKVSNELKREFRLVEGITIATNVILAIVGIVAVRAYYGQLDVMQGTLKEMKRSGQTASDQTWQAISNMNWLAKTMDGSLKESQLARASSEKQSRYALDASIEASRTDQRAWIASRVFS